MDDIRFLRENTISISLGYNCGVKKFLNEGLGINVATNFFDFIGSPMWGINELFNCGFNGLTDVSDYKNVKLLENEEPKSLTNTKYSLRFTHDLELNSSVSRIKTVVERYMRRKTRLYNILNSTTQVLFYRYEENMNNRIIHDEYKTKYTKKEYEYVKEFSDIIKIKFPKLKFKIIYFTRNIIESQNDHNNILSIDIKNYEPIEWANSVEKFSQIVRDNKDQIKIFLQNN